MTADDLKRQAALRAVEYVREGMDVGLGTGSTAEHAVREIGRRVREEALRVRCVATSDKISRLAAEVGLQVVTLEECPQLDVTIDGADEIVLGSLDAIKGMGGALLYEKMVALATHEEILIVDGSKVVKKLGDHTSVPVEVVRWGWTRTRDTLRDLDCEPGAARGCRPVALHYRFGQPDTGLPFLADGRCLPHCQCDQADHGRGGARSVPGHCRQGGYCD